MQDTDLVQEMYDFCNLEKWSLIFQMLSFRELWHNGRPNVRFIRIYFSMEVNPLMKLITPYETKRNTNV